MVHTKRVAVQAWLAASQRHMKLPGNRWASSSSNQPPAHAPPSAAVPVSPTPPPATTAPPGSTLPVPGLSTIKEGKPRGFLDPALLIPLFGLPAMAGWYIYQLYVQQQHEERINAVHEEIQKKRGGPQHSFQGMQQPFQVKELVNKVQDMIHGIRKEQPAAKQQESALSPSPPAKQFSPQAMSGILATTPGAAPALPDAVTQTAPSSQPVAKTSDAEDRSVKQEEAPAVAKEVAGPDQATSGAISKDAVPPTSAVIQPVEVSSQPLQQQAVEQGESASLQQPILPSKQTAETAESVQKQQQHAAAQQGESKQGQAGATVSSVGEQAVTREEDVSSGIPAATTAGKETAREQAATPTAGVTPTSQQPSIFTHEAGEQLPFAKKGVLGLHQDVTPHDLLKYADEVGRGPGPDSAAAAHHHNQAFSDAQLFAKVLEQISSWHESEMGQVKSQLSSVSDALQSVTSEKVAAQKRAEELVEHSKAAVESFKKLLRQHQEMAAELRNMEVAQAQKRTALAASRAAEEERVARSKAMDELRVHLSALAAAHEVRVSQQASSHVAHALSLTILALEQSLAAGLPLTPHLASLSATLEGLQASQQPSAQPIDITLLRAAAGSVPASHAAKGVLTVTQLMDRLKSIKPAISSLSFLPSPQEGGSSGGVLAHALAKLLSWLKVDEVHSLAVLGPEQALQTGGNSFSTSVSAAEQLLAQGKVLQAARLLQQGTEGSAAAAVVEGWCKDAAARATADQTVKLLRAHASVLAASVI